METLACSSDGPRGSVPVTHVGGLDVVSDPSFGPGRVCYSHCRYWGGGLTDGTILSLSLINHF